jgi:hypothetical protein
LRGQAISKRWSSVIGIGQVLSWVDEAMGCRERGSRGWSVRRAGEQFSYKNAVEDTNQKGEKHFEKEKTPLAEARGTERLKNIIKMARVTGGSRNPRHSKGEALTLCSNLAEKTRERAQDTATQR